MLDDMGIFRTTVEVESAARRGPRRALHDVMVDTGSEYTWIPRRVLEDLGIGVERSARFLTADGRVVERKIAFAIVHAGGSSAPDIVVFAEPGDATLLGARALEGLNVRVDPARKALIPAGPVPAMATRAA